MCGKVPKLLNQGWADGWLEFTLHIAEGYKVVCGKLGQPLTNIVGLPLGFEFSGLGQAFTPTTHGLAALEQRSAIKRLPAVLNRPQYGSHPAAHIQQSTGFKLGLPLDN